jgi:hypothetical protein
MGSLMKTAIHRTSFVASALLVALAPNGKLSAQDNALPAAIGRMQTLGAEGDALARRVGTWDVVVTFRSAPDTAPVVTRGLIAERTMIGLFLQEILKPAPGSAGPDFRRIAYLTYNRVEGRWQYVSLDTRLPVGIMPAYSVRRDFDPSLTLVFEPLAFVGFGAAVEGRMMRSDIVFTREGDDRDVVRQHWIRADGTGRDWVAVQYEYTRRR